MAEDCRSAPAAGEDRPDRPRPVIGDASSAAERQADPAGWAMSDAVNAGLFDVIGGRRDIRRYRPDVVPDELLRRVLEAGHAAPSVGHSQPWRFLVVRDAGTRDRAAHLADRARLAQADGLMSDRAARLLDLKLEGLREAPVGVVVACDRRTPAAGVLGRATFPDTDMWSCACAIENMWLTARGLGLGMGWVTLFEPGDLGELLHLPEGVETLGWMCLGWPDERPPEPGLQRAAWSKKLPLEDVIMHERWPDDGAPNSPVSHLRAPDGPALVGATDGADELLAPPEALGVLDRVLNRVVGVAGEMLACGTLVLVGADHPIADLGVSAYDRSVTRDVMRCAVEGTSLGAAHAASAGLALTVVDAGVAEPVVGAVDVRASGVRGDIATTDALERADVGWLLERGIELGRDAAAGGLVVLGEAGVGNTTVASGLCASLLGLSADDVVGLGAGSDTEMLERKRVVVSSGLARLAPDASTLDAMAAVGGPELVVLAGVTVGAARAGVPVVLDGLATSVAALAAVRMEPSVQGYLVAGQRSREAAHGLVLRELGLEPLLALRLRAGEGIGGVMAASMILQALWARRGTVRTV